jgi:hypothetical protein
MKYEKLTVNDRVPKIKNKISKMKMKLKKQQEQQDSGAKLRV